MGKWFTDHESNGSPKLDESHESWVSGVDSLTHKYFIFTVTVMYNLCNMVSLLNAYHHHSIDSQIYAEITIIKLKTSMFFIII
jgi:hypothetical protein